jgi:Tetracyclin repressor-like, C-terminal domain
LWSFISTNRSWIRSKYAGSTPASAAILRLVVQFFGSKQELFAVATLPPVTLAALTAQPATDPTASAGLRLARLVMLRVGDEDTQQSLVARIRAASSEPVAADLVREVIGGQLVELTRVMEGDRPDVRASLIPTQGLGIGPIFDLYLGGPPESARG